MSETQVNQIASAVEEMAFANESPNTVMPPKKNIIAPPTWFNLVKISNFDMLSQISYLTRQFNDLPPDLANWIIYDAQTRPYSFYGTIPAPPSTDLVKQIIGINGYYLKLTTQNSLVDFIWHDRVRNEFQFWGEYQSCVKAMKEIRYRICKYVEMNKETTPALLAVSDTAPVFYNDIHPHPAVCLEAIIELDENGEYKKTVASKYYPDAN
jgi:hypothetical protein